MKTSWLHSIPPAMICLGTVCGNRIHAVSPSPWNILLTFGRGSLTQVILGLTSGLYCSNDQKMIPCPHMKSFLLLKTHAIDTSSARSMPHTTCRRFSALCGKLNFSSDSPHSCQNSFRYLIPFIVITLSSLTVKDLNLLTRENRWVQKYRPNTSSALRSHAF